MGQTNDRRVEKHAKNAVGSKRGKSAHEGAYDLTTNTYMILTPLAICLARRGGALRIGLTRDGGALALGIYIGDDYGNEYVKPSEDLHQAVEEIMLAWLPSVVQEFVELREALYAALNGRKLP